MRNDMRAIPPEEVTFHAMSHADPNGRLFHWRGGLYRALSHDRSVFVRDLFDRKVIDRLVSDGLIVDTTLQGYTLAGFDAIVRQRKIDPVTYPYEWCAEMLRDAAVAMLELNDRLARQGLTLQDAHSWNMVFDGPHPYFIDLGSIVPLDGKRMWSWTHEFKRFFWNPLLLMCGGLGKTARYLLYDYEHGICDEQMGGILGGAGRGLPAAHLNAARKLGRRLVPPTTRRLVHRLVDEVSGRRSENFVDAGPDSVRRHLAGMRRRVEALTIPGSPSGFPDRSGDGRSGSGPMHDDRGAQSRFLEILARTSDESLMDVRSSRDWYSLTPAQGKRILAMDREDSCVAQVYRTAKAERLSILPIVGNVLDPAPGLGPCNEYVVPALSRLKCDMVVALSLVHDLVFRRYMRFEPILKSLGAFARRAVVVEFVSRDDDNVNRLSRGWQPDDYYDWYTTDTFVRCARRYFAQVEVLPTDCASHVLVYCQH